MSTRLTTLDGPKVRVEHVFDASCDELFDAWITPARLVRWFVPDHYLASAAECTISPEPGGMWSLRMADPEPDERPQAQSPDTVEIDTVLTKVRTPSLLAGATSAVTRVGELRDVGLKITFRGEASRCRLRVRQGPLASAGQAHALADFWAEAFRRLEDHVGEAHDRPRLAAGA